VYFIARLLTSLYVSKNKDKEALIRWYLLINTTIYSI
jgi:hypothetical protein